MPDHILDPRTTLSETACRVHRKTLTEQCCPGKVHSTFEHFNLASAWYGISSNPLLNHERGVNPESCYKNQHCETPGTHSDVPGHVTIITETDSNYIFHDCIHCGLMM